MASAEQREDRARTVLRLATMERHCILKAAIVAVLFVLTLCGIVPSSILRRRESEKLEAGWEVFRGRMGRGWDDGDFAVGFHLGHSHLYVWISILSLL